MDYGHKESDKMLKDLEKRLQEEYAQAERELAEKIAQYFKAYERKNAVKLMQLNAGQITPKEYFRWKQGQLLIGQRWQEMQTTIATDLHNVNKIAGAMISDHAKDVYALNHNYGTFEVEKGSMVDTSYTLYNRDAVERLMIDNPDILPPPGKRVSQRIAEGKDVLWNKQQVQSVMAQSILQGESIPKIAKRLEGAVGKSYTEDIIKNADKKTAKQIAKELARKNKVAAIRNARTMTTGAENAGRVDAYKRGQEMGVKSKQMWVATLDSRTRHEHRMLDGQTREVGEPFEIDGKKLRFPGDPTAPPYLVYNCRCGVIAVVKGSKLDKEGIEGIARRDEKLGDMTYDEWKNAKAKPAPSADKPKSEQKPDKGTNTPPTPEKAKNEPLSKPESKPVPVAPAVPEKPKQAEPEKVAEIKPTKPEFSFTPAKTIEEAEQYAKDNFVVKSSFSGRGNVSYHGMSLGNANAINEEFTRLFAETNMPKLNNIGMMNFREKIWKDGKDAPMAYRSMQNGEIYFNPKILKDEKTLAAYLKKGEESFEFCKNNMDKFSGKTLEMVKQYMQAGRQTVAEAAENQLHAMLDHEFGHHVDHSVFVFNKEYNQIARDGINKYGLNLSGYAVQTKGEYLAESFCAYMNGIDGVDPSLIKIFEEAVIKK